jgi:hypothetical protein
MAYIGTNPRWHCSMNVSKKSLTCHNATLWQRKVELVDQSPIRRMSPIQTPLPRAEDTAVARVDAGGASMPAS